MLSKKLVKLTLLITLYNSTCANIRTLYSSALEKQVFQCSTYEQSIFYIKGSQKIRKLHSTNYTLAVLNEGIISGLLHVEKIILSGNQITAVKTSAFVNLPMLKYIYLSHNKIATLEFNIFVKVPKLLRVHLDNNKLWYFEQQWLGEVSTLESLNLEHNFIKTITSQSFTNFPNLLYINFGHNQIRYIDEDAFAGVHRLEILDMSYNRIQHLPDTVFADMRILQVLNLYYNQLNYMSDEVLEHLRDLHEFMILFNPWQCGCYNKMFNWAYDNSVGFKNNYLQCKKTKDMETIPTCVSITNNLTECLPNREDFCDILYSHADFECSFQYERYIDI